MKYEYKPVPVEQLADYLQNAVEHADTFLPVTFFRNVVRELYDIKTRKAPATAEPWSGSYNYREVHVGSFSCVVYDPRGETADKLVAILNGEAP